MKAVLFIFILISAISDIRIGGIKKSFSVLSLILAFIFKFILHDTDYLSIFLGVIPAIILFIPAYFRKEIIGYGDIVVIAVSGIVLGLLPVLELIVLGMLLNAIYGGILLICHKKKLKDRIAFIPSLFIAYLISFPMI